MHVYTNAQDLSKATDPEIYAEELLNNEPSIPIIEASGLRFSETLKVLWDDKESVVRYNRENPIANEYSNSSNGVFFSLVCDDPTSVGIED